MEMESYNSLGGTKMLDTKEQSVRVKKLLSMLENVA